MQIYWFRNETIQLDLMIEKQTREIKKYENREEVINEDRKFLKGQTKEAMKQNKVL